MRKLVTPIILVLFAIWGVSCKIAAEPLRALFATRTPVWTSTPASTSTPLPSPTPTQTPTPLPPARLGVGERFLLAGDYEQGLQQYQTALDEAGDDDTRAGALAGIGRIKYLKGDNDAALAALDQLISKYPDSQAAATAYFYRARIQSDLKNFSDAAADYGSYLKLRPGVLDAYMEEAQGDALNTIADYQGAIKAYQAAAEAPQLDDPVYTRIKIGKAYAASGDNTSAVRLFMQIYDASTNDYIKAQMDLLAGQMYINMGLPEQADARFQDAVNNYPRSYDSYSALVALIDAGVDVNELNRGLVDYYAGQYGVAIDVFTRYIKDTPDHDGTAHYYKAMSLRQQNQPDEAVTELNALIKDHAGDRFYPDAYREKAYTQWAYQDRYDFAAQTMLSFIRLYPTDPNAPDFLFEAGRIYERGGMLTEAANTWQRLMTEYPSAESSFRALFLAGITSYRLKDYQGAQTIFQRGLVLASNGADQAQSYLWIGKTAQVLGNKDAARNAWEQGALKDPTGYYSERARNLLLGRSILYAASSVDLGYDLEREQAEAQNWMRQVFNLPADTILSGLGELSADPRLQRGNAFWQLGLYAEARNEFEALRKEMENDPVNTYRLTNHFLQIGLYRSAILASRQVLTLANMDDAASLNAPVFFNHVRFGTYFKDLVLPSAKEEDFNPLFLFSVLRQESLFEGFAYSSAGARGLMQIMPATGQEIVDALGWPPDYSESDLTRPLINIPLGSRYLARQRDYFDGDLFTALAGYNGGPGNAQAWQKLSNNDPDLFLEVIRYDETRLYLMQISDFLNIYNRIYTRNP